MSDKFLRQFTEKIGNGHHHEEPPDEPPEDLGAFGWLRGSKERAYMLEIRRKDGNIKALGYAWLESCDFDPSDGIILRFTGQAVRLVGRNLNREMRPHLKLFEGLVRHRIPWIQEADEPTVMTAAQQATLIERVEFL